MPFVELLAPPAPPAVRRRAARAITGALCDAFAVAPETVTLFFLDVPPGAYAHAGLLGEDAPEPRAPQRLFCKVHAFRRDAARRGHAAAMIAPALAEAYGLPPAAVALYFLERAPDEVSHAGRLASDEGHGP